MATSLRRSDLLSLCNLRSDGRKSHEIRRLAVQLGPLSSSGGASSGSAIAKMGVTMALASVSGPSDCNRRSEEHNDKATLIVNLKVSPFASSVMSGADRKLVNEEAHLLQKAMEAAVIVNLFPRSKIEINVLILTDDGGRLCAAINATTLALIDAGIPMKDMVCACSAGIINNNNAIMVDLNRQEQHANQGGQPSVYLLCAVLPQRNTVVLSQCESRIPLATYEQLLNTAMDGCKAVFEIIQGVVRDRAAILLASQAGNVRIRLHPSLEDEEDKMVTG